MKSLKHHIFVYGGSITLQTDIVGHVVYIQYKITLTNKMRCTKSPEGLCNRCKLVRGLVLLDSFLK